ncbi:hypothetical protein SMC1_09870, partial [Candidatus Cryosericum septentrionale]
MPRRGIIYIVAVVATAIGLAVAAFFIPNSTSPVSPVWFVMVLVCAIVADMYPIVYLGFGSTQIEVTV